jgi:uncharacterized protein (TIGR03435 family)
MRPAILAACWFLATTSLAFSQAKPEFEVASVKPSASPYGNGPVAVGSRGGPGSTDPSRITYNRLGLNGLLTTAYGVQPYQVIGPDWLATERFDVTATIPEGATKDDVKLMLQNLLVDRFHLTLHHETRELPLYELTVGKGGPKMKPSVEDTSAQPGGPSPPPTFKDGVPQLPAGHRAMMLLVRPGGLHMVANVQTLAMFAQNLSNQLRSPVVDKTGLAGTYDFVLDFTLDRYQGFDGLGGVPPPPPPPAGGATGTPVAPLVAPPQDEAPSIFVALQEQLGLRLEKKKGPVDVLVIDHADKMPTEN